MKNFEKILIANRGEIAIRIMRTAREFGISSTAIYAQDDAEALHCFKADEALSLVGRGPAAYLDGTQIISMALAAGCEAIHPGYGFLSENADFARACEAAGLVFVGPTPTQLSLFGDKANARALAKACEVPLLPGTVEPVSLEEARAFMKSLPAGASVMIKAIAGGGGRGMRAVDTLEALDDAYERCHSEARAAFGNGALYIEQRLTRARHIEVQIIGDGQGEITHLYERECSLQRRNQKVLEFAPCSYLPTPLREQITAAAVRLAGHADYRSLGTVEFLLDASGDEVTADTPFYFMEANPRIQVEHTITEEVTGIDLVAAQFEIACGKSLAELGLLQKDIPAAQGFAIEARINMESLSASGEVTPSMGQLSVFEPPSGHGIRNDVAGYSGYMASPSYDSMLAKLIVHSPRPDFSVVVDKTYQALCEYRIEGVQTNIGFLLTLLDMEALRKHEIYTALIEENMSTLAGETRAHHPQRFPEQHRGQEGDALLSAIMEVPPGTEPVTAPMQGVIVDLNVAEGDSVSKGQQLLVLEAMKMEHVVTASQSGIIVALNIETGALVTADTPLLFMSMGDELQADGDAETSIDLDHIRADLLDVQERHGLTLDAQRPEAVAKRHGRGRRTARENIADLCDEGSFNEYGALTIAAQRNRRALDDLYKNTPADGLVAGTGAVNGALFQRSRAVVMSYDYTVMAGTQGVQNHRKKDRLIEIAEKEQLPVVLFAEGGGGRPGDTDFNGISGLDCISFYKFARLSGKVPLVGVASGRCFAGNAALLGCCDVTIATQEANIGMGGPAMIEGGGLGQVRPEDIGPIDIQCANGVIDIAVDDDAQAVHAAKKYLGYFQGDLKQWSCADQRRLRHLVPENRMRAYDMRVVMETLCDTDSFLELRKGFGPGMLTALARVEGKPIGIIANNPSHMGGAITSDGADKAARFMQLCNVFGLPILFLCDTPGIMVGPEAEKSGTVRHAARLMVTGANLTVPFFTIVTRKAYGLGALTMAGGAFPAALFAVSWPTGEMGPMGLEGAVTLGFRKELEAIADPAARKARFDELVSAYYELGKAVSVASYFEIDDVIDPADSRRWIVSVLDARDPNEGTRPIKPYIDPW